MAGFHPELGDQSQRPERHLSRISQFVRRRAHGHPGQGGGTAESWRPGRLVLRQVSHIHAIERKVGAEYEPEFDTAMAKEKLLVALTVFSFTEAVNVLFNDLLPLTAAFVAGILSP